MAIQKPAINNIFGPIGNLISLSIIYLLIITAKKSIVLLGFVLIVFKKINIDLSKI